METGYTVTVTPPFPAGNVFELVNWIGWDSLNNNDDASVGVYDITVAETSLVFPE